MDYQDIVTYATEHTGISITLDKALKYVKKRRNNIADIIKDKINKDYFSTIFTTDIVAGQRTYVLPTASSSAL